MALSMYSSCVPQTLNTLRNMLGWLDKAAQSAKARDFDPDVLLALRLSPNMFSLSRQIQVTSDTAKNAVARLSGATPPTWEDNESTIDELRARIEKTIAYVESIPADAIDGSESREIVMPAGPDHTLHFDGEGFLRSFMLPNFYFHASMTYALLRHAGVDLGKMDFLGSLEIKENA